MSRVNLALIGGGAVGEWFGASLVLAAEAYR
jgi:hypothetical protein